MKNKVTIIGAGMVGSTIAYSLIMRDMTEEIALIDIDESLVHAQVLDLQHAVPFTGTTHVHVGTYDDCRDSSIVIMTAGAAQEPGQSRLELVQKNARIMRDIVPRIFAANADATLVIVSNPVDILTRLAIEMFPEKKGHILGTGTILDSGRLRHLLSQALHVSAQSIHAYIIGEHGDSELPLWSSATVGGMKLIDHPELTPQKRKEIFEDARSAAYTIIAGKQATYYAIGAGAADLADALLHDTHTVLPVSHNLDGMYGINDVCLSMPAIVGRGGVIETVHVNITQEEQDALTKSAYILHSVLRDVE